MISAARCGTTKNGFEFIMRIENLSRKNGKYTGEKKNLIIKTTFCKSL